MLVSSFHTKSSAVLFFKTNAEIDKLGIDLGSVGIAHKKQRGKILILHPHRFHPFG